MKNEKDIHTQSAGVFSVGAILNARLKNAVGMTQFSPSEQAAAIRVHDVMDMFYNFSLREINYRPGKKSSCGAYKSRFIAVKLRDPEIKSRKPLRSYEAGLDMDRTYKKVEKRNNPETNSILYRFYF